MTFPLRLASFSFVTPFCIALVAASGLLGARAAQAQELDCTVTVDYSQISGSEYTFLDEMGRRVEEYVNEETWTDDSFQPYERIDCEMRIFIQEALSLSRFRARMVVASRRPIYGTTQATPVVQFSDAEWTFDYTQGEALTSDLRRYDDFTSVLDFYVYVLLGYDYDTFSELGGTPHFEQAREIVELAQSAGAAGWSSLGSSGGRETLVTQLLDPRYRPLRLAYFNYHFTGLDHFVQETDAAREAVLDVLTSLETLYEDVTRRYVLDLFFTAKFQELSAIFEASDLGSSAYAVLSRLDPSHDYNRLVE